MYRSSTSYFCGHYSFGPCVNQLINLICNMLGNMLNDLAEAIRRWTEKRFYWSLPLGIVASGDGLVALPLCVECLLRIVSPLHYVSWQQRPLALCGDLSLYTMLPVLLGCCVLPH